MPNSYYTSNDAKLSQSQIEKLITKAKKEFRLNLVQDGGWKCEKCGKYAENSHIISVKEAKENSLSELCFDLDNLEALCNYHHTEFERKNKHERKQHFLNKLIENENFTKYDSYASLPYFGSVVRAAG